MSAPSPSDRSYQPPAAASPEFNLDNATGDMAKLWVIESARTTRPQRLLLSAHFEKKGPVLKTVVMWRVSLQLWDDDLMTFQQLAPLRLASKLPWCVASTQWIVSDRSPWPAFSS